jgi:hypothetical protein
VRNITEINLNTLLDRPAEERFELDFESDEGVFGLLSDPRLERYYSNKWFFKILRTFLVHESFKFTPEVKIVDKAIELQERVKRSATNSFFLPVIALSAQADYNFYRGGAGSTLEPIEIPNLGSFQFGILPEDLSWSVGLNASLPIFQGGARFAETARADYELSRLSFEKKNLMNLIEQRVRSALHQSGASYAGLTQSIKAQEAAMKTLELVTDAYSRGTVSIVELLDAQNAALVASEAAEDARYTYLIDLLGVQRAVGFYFYSLSEEEKDSFFERLEKFFADNIDAIDQ